MSRRSTSNQRKHFYLKTKNEKMLREHLQSEKESNFDAEAEIFRQEAKSQINSDRKLLITC